MSDILVTPFTRFWVVTKPAPASTIEDICFETDLDGLRLQFLGGLGESEIHGLYKTEDAARTAALTLLSQRSQS